MSNTITMYDSVTISEIPKGAEAVAGYTSGRFPTWPQLLKAFPKAKRLSIAIDHAHDAECLDVETGDATPADAPAWVKRQHASGIAEPVVYANESTMPAVIAFLTAAGIHRSEYRLWVAHYDDVNSLVPGYDAKQYYDRALGKNLDISICREDFFGHTQKPAYAPADEKRWEHEFKALDGKNTPWVTLRRRVLKRTMVHREREIVTLAELSGWSVRNRRDRYRKLFQCTQAR